MLLETFYREPGSARTSRRRSITGTWSSRYRCRRRRRGGRSAYLKVRERASYEFALGSVAASVAVDGE